MIFLKNKTDWKLITICRKIYKDIDSEYNLIFDTTWTENKDFLLINEWCEKNKKNFVFISSLYDSQPDNFLKFTKLFKHKDRIKTITHKDIWIHLLDFNNMLNYTADDLAPDKTFLYKFLCYQRKVYSHREILYSKLQDEKGLITIGNKNFPEINKYLPQHNGWEDGSDDWFVGVDTYSLGNMEIWKNSFLNIVSETYQNLNQEIFLSEKTIKPIIGMRPFIIYGNPNSSKFLQEKGFETFDEDFGYQPTNNYEEQANSIKKIVNDLSNCEKFYEKLLPKLKHNREQINVAVKNEWEKYKEFVKLHRLPM